MGTFQLPPSQSQGQFSAQMSSPGPPLLTSSAPAVPAVPTVPRSPHRFSSSTYHLLTPAYRATLAQSFRPLTCVREANPSSHLASDQHGTSWLTSSWRSFTMVPIFRSLGIPQVCYIGEILERQGLSQGRPIGQGSGGRAGLIPTEACAAIWDLLKKKKVSLMSQSVCSLRDLPWGPKTPKALRILETFCHV